MSGKARQFHGIKNGSQRGTRGRFQVAASEGAALTLDLVFHTRDEGVRRSQKLNCAF